MPLCRLPILYFLPVCSPTYPVYCLPPACLLSAPVILVIYYHLLSAHLSPPPTFLTHKRFLLFIFFLSATLKSAVCSPAFCRHLRSAAHCLPFCLPPPPPPPHAVYCIRFNARVCRLPGYKAIEKKHVISNKYKTAIFK